MRRYKTTISVKKVLLLFITPILIFIIIGFYWFTVNSKPVSNETKSQDFLIIKGSSASRVGNKLKEEGFIKSSLAFKLYVQVTDKAKKIQAGEYRLSPGYSLSKIVGELIKGPVEVWITIPEGLRREEVAYKFTDSLGQDVTFVQEFLDITRDKEGFLFPDTYLFPKTASASAVVDKLLTTFERKIGKDIQRDVITMASLIERETKSSEEKPIVAGIIYKRLKAEWPLQIDATLQYAVADIRCQLSDVRCNYWEQITPNDKKINSLYNTYKFKGLPPTPIANPGLSSIKAAIYPEESDYWFYLHDSKGVIHFAKTAEEHNENIGRYLNRP